MSVFFKTNTFVSRSGNLENQSPIPFWQEHMTFTSYINIINWTQYWHHIKFIYCTQYIICCMQYLTEAEIKICSYWTYQQRMLIPPWHLFLSFLRSLFAFLLFCIFLLDFWYWTLFVITTFHYNIVWRSH